MSFAKRQLELRDRGWDATDDLVCSDCVDDEDLTAKIAVAEQPDETCTFCGRTSAANIDALMEPFIAGVRRVYERAVEELPWDSSEGGWQAASVIDSHDLVGMFEEYLTGPGLADAVRGMLNDEDWVERDWAVPLADEALRESWDRFVRQVKYETRFVFWRLPIKVEHAPGEIPPSQILEAVGQLVDIFPETLTTEVGPDTLLWRARPHDAATPLKTGASLGTAPVEFSKPNRMSPAGIPMFYGALDAATAELEACQDTEHENISVGAFRASGVLKLLDLTHLPPVPSIFADNGDERPQWTFLHYFTKQLRQKPVLPDVDYVPTQVVTEYFLRVFGDGDFFDGVMYHSDVTGGDTCVVVDVRNDGCVDIELGWDSGDKLRLALDVSTLDTKKI